MRLIESAKEKVLNWAAERLEYRDLRDENWLLHESLADLRIELENLGYQKLSADGDYQFSRQALGNLIERSVAMAIKNPITCRTVNVQADYVFGRGVKFCAAHPVVQQVIDEHVEQESNQRVLYSHDSMARQERELQVKGNLFYALFTNPRTGRVLVRDIDTTEIVDIHRNPDDYHEVWFYKRVFTDGNNQRRVQYFPAVGITKDDKPFIPSSDNEPEYEIKWESAIVHISFNRYGRMKFGIPEIYPQLDWATAYKNFLENWSSIIRAYARMAMKITGLGGKKQAAAAKSKINTQQGLNNPLETNPSQTAAGFGLFGKGVDIEPVKTAGATTPAKEGQPLLNMAAAGSGLPNTFYGDASVGNHATATTLDRPTELKMVARQRLWADIFHQIFCYVIYQAAKSEAGILREFGATLAAKVDDFTDKRTFVLSMPVNKDELYGTVGVPISTCVQVKFPELLERNVTDRVRALVNALTLFGKPLMDIVPDKRLVCRLLLEALNVDNIDELMPQFMDMWTKNMAAGDDGKPVEPYIIPPPPPDKKPGGAEDPSQGGDVGANG